MCNNDAPSWEDHKDSFDGESAEETRVFSEEYDEEDEKFKVTVESCNSRTMEDTENDTESDTSVSDAFDGSENVLLNTVVNVDGATDQQIKLFEQIAKLLEQNYTTFVEKNLDYGSSFTLGGELTSLRDGGPFEDAKKANLYQTFTRSGDKRNRFYQQVFAGGDDRVGEGAVETALDNANYWIMMAWILRHYEPQTQSALERLTNNGWNSNLADEVKMNAQTNSTSLESYGTTDD